MTIKPQTVHGRTRWRVTWRSLGQCHRKFFPSKSAAETFASVTKQDMRDYGEQFASLLAHERAALVEAFKRAQRRGYSINEALDYFEAHNNRASSATVAEVCSGCLAAKKARGVRDTYYAVIKISLNRFAALHGPKRAADVKPSDISAFLDNPNWGQHRRMGVLRDLHTCFEWAIRAGLLVENPANGVEQPLVEKHPIVIFTPQECTNLLKLATSARFKQIVPFVTICLFAGLRPKEAAGLNWSAVDLEGGWVEVGALISKTRSRRLVKLRPTAVAWLKPLKGEGLVLPKHARKRVRRFRETFKSWPRDVLRHSWVSYELAMSDNAAATALQAGHAESVMFKHYRQLATKKTAEEFWALTPDKVGV